MKSEEKLNRGKKNGKYFSWRKKKKKVVAAHAETWTHKHTLFFMVFTSFFFPSLRPVRCVVIIIMCCELRQRNGFAWFVSFFSVFLCCAVRADFHLPLHIDCIITPIKCISTWKTLANNDSVNLSDSTRWLLYSNEIIRFKMSAEHIYLWFLGALTAPKMS